MPGRGITSVNAVNSYGVEVHIVYDGTPTGVADTYVPMSNTRKLIRDGQLLIIRNDEEFNLLGVRL